VVETCPVCDQTIPPAAVRCPTCGFPVALMTPNLGPFPGADDGGSDGSPANRTESPEAPAPSPPPEPPLNAALGRALAVRMELLQTVVRDPPDITSDLCQAALSEASGHDSEGLAILRSAQSRLERESERTVARLLARIGERRSALERSGLKIDLAGIPPTTDRVDLAAVEELLPSIHDADERLGRLESDWKGIRGLLEQIDTLRSEAETIGIPLGDVPDRIATVRTTLSSTGVTEEGLDSVVLEASRILMDLHEAVPNALDEELARHSTSLGRLPAGHPGADTVRRAHARAAQQLKEGRFTESIRGVRELRHMIESLQPIPGGADTAPRPASAQLTPAEEALLVTLLTKSRSLAARVRQLPAESREAVEAAAQIREATELLRARRLTEADLALTRLMRSLTYPESPA
jgi:hypothetical protein